jgi:hypothetical protein
MPTQSRSPQGHAPAPGWVRGPDGVWHAPSRWPDLFRYGFPWAAVTWGLIGIVPTILFTWAAWAVFRPYSSPEDMHTFHLAIGLGLAVIGIVLLAVGLLIPTRTRGVASVLFLVASVLTVVWPVYRGETDTVTVAVVFSSVPLLLAAVLAVRAWKRPLRVPVLAGLVVTAIAGTCLILVTVFQAGWL